MRKNAVNSKHLLPFFTCILFLQGQLQMNGLMNGQAVSSLAYFAKTKNVANGRLGEHSFYAVPITGKITSASGEALQGVVIEVRPKQTAVTDAGGNFSITLENGTETLVVSHVAISARRSP